MQPSPVVNHNAHLSLLKDDWKHWALETACWGSSVQSLRLAIEFGIVKGKPEPQALSLCKHKACVSVCLVVLIPGCGCVCVAGSCVLLYALVFVFLCAMVLSATLTGKSGAMYVAGFVRETNQGLGKAGWGRLQEQLGRLGRTEIRPHPRSLPVSALSFAQKLVGRDLSLAEF